MTLGDLGSLGEIVGAIGAVAALVYLALQIRQNTEALRVNSYHQATAELARLLDAIYSNPEFADVFQRGSVDPASLREQEMARFSAYVASFYYAYENLFDLYDKGRVEAEAWENAFQNAWPLFARPGIAQFGSRRKGAVSERFGHYRRTYGQSAAQCP